MPTDYDVFVSYSGQDRPWVAGALLPKLEAAGLNVCVDYRDFRFGAPYVINMERAVSNSQHTLLVLTPNWLKNEWAEFQSLLAVTRDPTGRWGSLIPLVLEPCSLPTRLSCLTSADFTDPSEHHTLFGRLISQLVEKATREAPTPPEQEMSFVAGPPITEPRSFFGRAGTLRRVFSLWSQMPLQNAAIIGPRRSGKTSLLLFLKSITRTTQDKIRKDQRCDWLPNPENYRWVFVDFQDPRLGTKHRLVQHLLKQLNLPVDPDCSVEQFVDVVSRDLNVPTVILLDEIGTALGRRGEMDDDFWESMRFLAGSKDNLAFALASHEPLYTLVKHTGHSSPFFNIFGYTAHLRAFSEAETRELIGSSTTRISANDADWIVQQSGRWPLLVQILCRECLMSDGDGIESWREEALEQLEPFKDLLDH